MAGQDRCVRLIPRHRRGGTAILGWATGAVVVAAVLVAVFAITSAWPITDPTVEVSPAHRAAKAPATARSTPLAPLHVVGIGDSVMAGTNCNCETIMTGFAHAIADRTARNVTATNLGVQRPNGPDRFRVRVAS